MEIIYNLFRYTSLFKIKCITTFSKFNENLFSMQRYKEYSNKICSLTLKNLYIINALYFCYLFSRNGRYYLQGKL